jgi:hypothetical protein
LPRHRQLRRHRRLLAAWPVNLVPSTGRQVRLWVDDLSSLSRCARVDTISRQTMGRRGNLPLDGTGRSSTGRARSWSKPLPANSRLGTCRQWLPRRQAMLDQSGVPDGRKPWIDACHGIASPHPSLPLTKYFFFPGFSAASGGLATREWLVGQAGCGLHPSITTATKSTSACSATTRRRWSAAGSSLRLLPSRNSSSCVSRANRWQLWQTILAEVVRGTSAMHR